MENLAKKIKLGLINKGLTQKELGAMLGVQQSAVSNWVKGIRTPPFKKLEKISIILDFAILDKQDDLMQKIKELEAKIAEISQKNI